MPTSIRFPKEQVLAKLRGQVAAGLPVIATAAGNGLIARLEDKSGADLIVVYNSGHYRMNGIASIAGNLPIGDANQMVYDMGKNQILNMVSKTPVVAGIYGVDPTRDIAGFLNQLAEIGYSGVINFPTIGKLSGPIRAELEQVGLGFDRELGSLKLAGQMGFLTMAYCYNQEEAKKLADAGIDVIVSHVGLTTGGDVGADGSPLDAAIERTQLILRAALDAKPDMIALCHGGAIVSPQDVSRVLHSTCAMGFVGASSIERLPIEDSIRGVVTELKELRLS